MTERLEDDCLKKVVRRVCQTVLSERDSESVRFVKIEKHVPHV